MASQDQSQGVFHYLNEVLGVREFLPPQESAIVAAKKIGLFLESELSADERDFVFKMLAAISVSEREAHWWVDGQTQEGAPALFYLCFSEKRPPVENVKAYQLPKLSTLLGVDATPAETSEAKKSAWQILKNVKKEIDVWLS